MPTSSPELTSLVLEWQELRRLGKPAPAERLCAKAPLFLEPLKQQIAAIESMEQLLGSVVTIDQQPSTLSVAHATSAEKRTGEYHPDANSAQQVFQEHFGSTWPLAPQGYQVLCELGRGGMGVVYKALQIKAKRVVALKMILSGGHASQRELERFRIEGESVARLQHANIVQVFDVSDHDGMPYFALEFCEGGNLAKKLAGTPMPAREAAELVAKLARAMAEAHAKGIIHRDLKPANVLLSNTGEPKITDFGLAKQLDTELEQTQSGAIMGTPSYMAPEQASGDTKRVGTACDVYALGAILYECLTGRPPFKGASLVETLDQVRNQEPVPPSQLNSKAPRDLEIICLKCLRKETEKRYSGALELAEDMSRYLDGMPIVARAVSKVERTVKWAKRNPVVAALFAAIFVSLLLGATVASYFALRARDEANRANAKADDATRAVVRANLETERAAEQKRLATESAELAEAQFVNSSLVVAQHALTGENVVRAREWLDKIPSHLRRWEWDFLRRQVEGGLFSLIGHTDAVHGVAWSRDGKWLATSGSDRNVRIWNARTGEEVRILHGHEAPVLSVAFCPYSRLLLSGSKDRTARVWDLQTGNETLILKDHPQEVTSVCFSPEGTRIATSCSNDHLQIWDAATGKRVCSSAGSAENLYSESQIVFHPDGNQLVTSGTGNIPLRILALQKDSLVRAHLGIIQSRGFWHVYRTAITADGNRLLTSSDEGIEIWNLATDQRVGALTAPGKDSSIVALAVSPDGSWVAGANLDNSIRIWDMQTGREWQTLSGHSHRVTALAFSPDSGFLLSSSEDRTGRVWSIRNREPGIPYLISNKVRQAIPTPDGRQFVTVEHIQNEFDRNDVVLRSLTTGEESYRLRHVKHEPRVVVAANGTRFVSTSHLDGKMRVWDTATGGLIQEFATYRHLPTAACASSDSARMAFGDSKGEVVLYDTAFTQSMKLPAQSSAIAALDFSGDARFLAVGTANGELVIWDPKGGKRVRTILTAAGRIHGLAVDLTGEQLGTTHQSGMVRIWSSTTGQMEREFHGCDGEPTCLAMTPDGTLIVAGTIQGELTLCNREGQRLRQQTAHMGAVMSVAISADGRQILSVGGDRIARLWNADDFKMVWATTNEHGKVHCARFSSSGRTVVTGGEDGAMHIWDRLSGEHLERIAMSNSPYSEPAILAVANAKTQKLVTVSYDGAIQHKTGARGGGNGIGSMHHGATLLAVSPDGRRLVTGFDRSIDLWDCDSGRHLMKFEGNEHTMTHGAITIDGKQLIAGGKEGVVGVWDMDSFMRVATFQAHDTAITALDVNQNGTQVVTGSQDRTAIVWDLKTVQAIARCIGHNDRVYTARFSMDGSRLVTGSLRDRIRIWDTRTGNQVADVPGDEHSYVESAYFTIDGKGLLTAASRVWLWSGKMSPGIDLIGHTSDVYDAAFSEDGTRIITGSDDSTARVWNTQNGQSLHVLRGHGRRVFAVAFSPDGAWVATGGEDNLVRLWDAQSGKQRHVLGGPNPGLAGISFSDDSTHITVYHTSKKQGTTTWDVATGERLTEAASVPLRDQGMSKDGLWVAVRLGSVCRIMQRKIDDPGEVERRRLATQLEKGWHQRQWLFADEARTSAFTRICYINGDLQSKAVRVGREVDWALKQRELHLRKALRANPEIGFAVRTLARTSCLSKQDPGRQDLIGSLTKVISSDNPLDLRLLGGLLLRENKASDAIPLLERARAKRHPLQPPIEGVLLALCHHQLKEADDARREIKKAQTWIELGQAPGILTHLVGMAAGGCWNITTIMEPHRFDLRYVSDEWEAWREFDLLYREAWQVVFPNGDEAMTHDGEW